MKPSNTPEMSQRVKDAIARVAQRLQNLTPEEFKQRLKDQPAGIFAEINESMRTPPDQPQD